MEVHAHPQNQQNRVVSLWLITGVEHFESQLLTCCCVKRKEETRHLQMNLFVVYSGSVKHLNIQAALSTCVVPTLATGGGIVPRRV